MAEVSIHMFLLESEHMDHLHVCGKRTEGTKLVNQFWLDTLLLV